MKIYLINLDRHPQRLERMEKLLQGLPFQRISAVDGRTVPGPEHRDPSRRTSRENLSRYERACMLSHRLAWEIFLAGREKYACVLEDDIYISPDFPKFVTDESWIPEDGNLVKIETSGHKVMLSRETNKCLDRTAAVQFSIHYGAAAYIVSRKGAADLLERTKVIDRPADFLLFDELAVRRHFPIYQLCPALCVQGSNRRDEIAFPELQSAIQPARAPERKSFPQKIRLEITRPFLQLAAALKIFLMQKWRRARRGAVPFA
jgi:glycosyl transferase family 25